jgi:hypothetical protein
MEPTDCAVVIGDQGKWTERGIDDPVRFHNILSTAVIEHQV